MNNELILLTSIVYVSIILTELNCCDMYHISRSRMCTNFSQCTIYSGLSNIGYIYSTKLLKMKPNVTHFQ